MLACSAISGLNIGGEVIATLYIPDVGRCPSYSRQEAHSISRRSDISYRIRDKAQVDDAIAAEGSCSGDKHLDSIHSLYSKVREADGWRHGVRRSEDVSDDVARNVL